MKGQSVFIMSMLLLVSIYSLTAQNLFDVDYYTVLPQSIYTIPESTTLVKTTVCTAGTEPGFGQELNSPGMNGVAGTRNFQIKSYPAPDGYSFYKMTIQLEKGKDEVNLDINKTFIITNTGYKAYPYYALPIIIGSVSLEKDLLKQDTFDKPFIITFPQGVKRKYIDVWYAIPVKDSPVTYEFFGSQCEVTKYIKKK